MASPQPQVGKEILRETPSDALRVGNMGAMTPELAHALTEVASADLGARIKAARVAAGLTQPDLGGADASAAFLSRIEKGERRPSAELLLLIADRLAVTPEYLLIGDGWEDVRRLELLLDHAELSLVGGEADSALDQAREALAPRTSAPCPVACVGLAWPRPAPSTRWENPPRSSSTSASSTRTSTRPRGSGRRPRCAGCGESAACWTARSRSRGPRSTSSPPASEPPRSRSACRSRSPRRSTSTAGSRRRPTSATGPSPTRSGSAPRSPAPRRTGTRASSARSRVSSARRSSSPAGLCTCSRTPSGSATSAGSGCSWV